MATLNIIKTKTCCLCGKTFIGPGNNPWPIMAEGACCDKCNYTRVLPARFELTVRHDVTPVITTNKINGDPKI